jgi:HSP20 family protein
MAIEKRKERNENVMDVYTPFKEMQRMIDRLFEEFPYEWPTFSKSMDEVIAPMDIFESDKGYEIEAELPGMNKNDIEVNVTDRVLTIKGEKSDERKEEKKGARILERSYGSFERSFTLPEDAEPEKIEAKYENGVLKLVIPKRPESKSKKVKVEVK